MASTNELEVAIQQPAKEKRKKQKGNSVIEPAIAVSVIPVETNEAEIGPIVYDPQTVSVTSCLVVMSIFVIGGAILFSIWEVTEELEIFFFLFFLNSFSFFISFLQDWGYVDGSYFCFTSLLTIGFGDFVPGQTIAHSQDAVDSKLIM